MSFLYIGTFGSFIGYSAAMPLLIKINFFRSPIPTASASASTSPTTPSSARCVGSVARPFGGWLADRFGGARVTLGAFVGDDRRHARRAVHAAPARHGADAGPGQVAACAKDPSTFPGFTPAVVDAVNHNSDLFPWFLACFLFVFAATGIGNGSTYRMIPAIWKTYAKQAGAGRHAGADRGRRQGDQGGLGRARHRRRGRCARRVPDPDHVQLAVGRRPGRRRPRARSWSSPRFYVVCARGDLGLLPPAEVGDGARPASDR